MQTSVYSFAFTFLNKGGFATDCQSKRQTMKTKWIKNVCNGKCLTVKEDETETTFTALKDEEGQYRVYNDCFNRWRRAMQSLQ